MAAYRARLDAKRIVPSELGRGPGRRTSSRRREADGHGRVPPNPNHESVIQPSWRTSGRRIIIGSGCAGLTAAIYAARANLKPLLVEGHEPGGQLSLTTLVENFPGFPEGIQGPELIENMRRQAERFGAEYLTGDLVSADLKNYPFSLKIGKDVLRTETLIIASGASARWLGPAQRDGADRTRRQLLRHLRRIFLQRQGNCGHRRRRFGHGRGAVPHPLRHQGHHHPPPRAVPRQQDHARPRPRPSANPVPAQHRGGRRL